MVSTLTVANIISQALRNLGSGPITSAQVTTPTTREALIAMEFWETVRDDTLAEHPWNFAKVRASLYAYTEPAATLTPAAVTGTVNFTASAAVFASTDVGREIRNQAGDGVAEITSFTSTTVVVAEITEDFPDTSAIAAEDWRLYYELPDWGYDYRIAVPSAALRVWRVDENLTYQVEGGYILTDEETLDVVYVKQESDTTTYSKPFVQALVAHLTSVLAKPITGQLQLTDAWLKIYQQRLASAKGRNGQEGTPEELEANILVDIR